MPGLMATREEYGPQAAARRPHRRLAAHDHPDGGADRDAERARRRRALGLLQHLFDAGPCRRGDRAAGTPVFAVKGESLTDYWDYTHRIFEWADGGFPNMILDDGGDATLLLHLGMQAETQCRRARHPGNEEEEVLFAAIKKRIKEQPGWYDQARQAIRGVTEETTTGVHRLYQMAKEGRCCSRRSTSTTASPSRNSTISTAAASRWSTASAAAPT